MMEEFVWVTEVPCVRPRPPQCAPPGRLRSTPKPPAGPPPARLLSAKGPLRKPLPTGLVPSGTKSRAKVPAKALGGGGGTRQDDDGTRCARPTSAAGTSLNIKAMKEPAMIDVKEKVEVGQAA